MKKAASLATQSSNSPTGSQALAGNEIESHRIHSLLLENRIYLIDNPSETIGDTARRAPSVIRYSTDLRLEPYTTFWGSAAQNLVSMGSFSYISGSVVPSLVSIGRYTSVARGLKIMGNKHPADWASTSPIFYNHGSLAQQFMKDHGQIEHHRYSYMPSKIKIGNDVWIGENVTLAHGITIGNGAVVASNAVVTKDVAPYTVVGGVPAHEIKKRFPLELSTVLNDSQWWNYSPDVVSRLNVTDTEAFAEAITNGALDNKEPFSPPVITAEQLNELKSQ